MARLTAREVARRYNGMMSAMIDGDDAGDVFEAWVEGYRMEWPHQRPAARPEAVSNGREGPKTVEWWRIGDSVIGIRGWDDHHYRIPFAALAAMPTASKGFAID